MGRSVEFWRKLFPFRPSTPRRSASGWIVAQCGWVKGRDHDRTTAAHAIAAIAAEFRESAIGASAQVANLADIELPEGSTNAALCLIVAINRLSYFDRSAQ
jgi:hypothetical protein